VLVSSAIGAAWFVTGSAQAQTVTGQGAAIGGSSSTASTPGNGNSGKGGNGGGNPHPLFSITGGASGLYPGDTGQLLVTVSNPNGYDINIYTVSVTAQPANGSCGASNLQITPYSGTWLIPKKISATRTLDIQMLSAAPNSCQGGIFPLAITASGGKA